MRSTEKIMTAIKRDNELLRVNENNHKALHSLAKNLAMLGKGDQKYYEEAEKAFNKAIKLNPESQLYLVNRAKLYVEIGKTDLAIEDYRSANELKDSDGDPITEMYIRNTMQDIAILEVIQNGITSLLDQGKISGELASVLMYHTRVTSSLAVQIGSQGEELAKHDKLLDTLNNEIERLRTLMLQLEKGHLVEITKLKQRTAYLEKELKQNVTIIKSHTERIEQISKILEEGGINALNEFEDQLCVWKKEQVELYNYCNALYWGLASHFNAYILTKTDLIEKKLQGSKLAASIVGGSEHSVKELTEVGIEEILHSELFHALVKQLHGIPVAGIVAGFISEGIKQFHHAYKEHKFDKKMDAIYKIITEKGGSQTALNAKLAKVALEITKQKNIQSNENQVAERDLKNILDYLYENSEKLLLEEASLSEQLISIVNGEASGIAEVAVIDNYFGLESEKHANREFSNNDVFPLDPQKFDELQEFIQKTAADINGRLNQVDMPAISSLILKHEVSEQEKKELEEINADVYKLAFYNGLRQQLNASYIAASVIATGIVKNNKSGNLGTFGTILEKVGEYTPTAGAGIKLFGEIISKIDYARQLEKIKLFADLVVDSGEMLELSELLARKLALDMDTLSIKINSKDIIEGIANRLNTGTVEVSNEAAIAAGLYKAIRVMKKGIKNISEYKKSGKDKAKIADYAQRFVLGADDTVDNMKAMQGHDDAVIVARKIIKEIFSGIKAGTIEEKAEVLLKHVEEIYRNVPIVLTSHLVLSEEKKEVGTDEAENTQDDEVTKFIMQEILGIDHGDFSGRGRAKAIEVMSEYVNDDTEKEEKTYYITTEPVNLTGVVIPETSDSATG